MAIEVKRPIEDLILRVLQHLGLAQAHVAARIPGDWQGLATRHPETIASLTLSCISCQITSVLRPIPMSPSTARQRSGRR